MNTETTLKFNALYVKYQTQTIRLRLAPALRMTREWTSELKPTLNDWPESVKSS